LDYKSFIRKFSSIIVALIAVSLGLLFPGIGLLWHPYTSIFLALIMFFVALNIKPREFVNSLRNYKIIFLALGLVFLLPNLKLLSPSLSVRVKGVTGPVVEGELTKSKEFGNRIANQLKF